MESRNYQHLVLSFLLLLVANTSSAMMPDFWLLDEKNATVINNNHEGDSPNCFSFRFQEVTGKSSGNTFNDEPYDLPLHPTRQYSNGCPIAER